jgi:hypothetical protein
MVGLIRDGRAISVAADSRVAPFKWARGHPGLLHERVNG